MQFQNRFFKYVTYFFIVIIIGLLILTLGVPEFFGKSASARRYIAADIEGRLITNKEVTDASTRILEQWGMKEVNAEFRQRAQSIALNQLVDRELFLQLAEDAGLYPLTDAQNEYVKQYLSENFPGYQNEKGFDFTRFEKEVMRPNNLNFKELKKQIADSYALSKSEAIFEKISGISTREIIETVTLEKTTLSYQIYILPAADKKAILKKAIGITEKQIVDRFTRDYLSKDPKEVLSEVKREAIVDAIINENKARVEEPWNKQFREDSAKLSPQQMERKYGGKLLTLKNVPIGARLADQDQKNGMELYTLENSPEFTSQLFNTPVNSPSAPWEISGATYIVTVTAINRPKLPAFDPSESSEHLITWLEENRLIDEKLKNSLNRDLKNQLQGDLYRLRLEEEKNEVSIKRYRYSEQ